jgi:hypothetical protein
MGLRRRPRRRRRRHAPSAASWCTSDTWPDARSRQTPCRRASRSTRRICRAAWRRVAVAYARRIGYRSDAAAAAEHRRASRCAALGDGASATRCTINTEGLQRCKAGPAGRGSLRARARRAIGATELALARGVRFRAPCETSCQLHQHHPTPLTTNTVRIVLTRIGQQSHEPG